MRSVSSWHGAFTVPEMLAVVAIIVIILSILMPSLGQGREVAREAICKSNLHQIALASRGYGTDTRHMPTGWNPRDGSVTWLAEVYDYVGRDAGFFYCPSAPEKAKWAGIQPGGNLPAEYGYRANEIRISAAGFFSYGHNNDGSQAGLNVGVGETTTMGWVKVAAVAAPSDFIMYGDSTVDGLWDHFIDEDYEDGAGRTEYPADRHRGGAHLTYGDGHVDHQLQKFLIHLGPVGTALPEMRRRWNNDNLPH